MNEEPKFTPGPWKAHRMRVYLPDRQNPLNVGFNERTVDNACANAALIAAAPEMYELLKEIFENRGKIFLHFSDRLHYINELAAVMKKARGDE